MCRTPAPPSTALVAARIWSGTGEVNTSPGQAASSIPYPTYPPCSGSCPDPPPDTRLTLPGVGPPARVMYRSVVLTDSDGCAAATPASASVSTSSGALISFFTTTPCRWSGHADGFGGGGVGDRRRLDRADEGIGRRGQQAGQEGRDEIHGYLLPQQPLAAAHGRPGDHRAEVPRGVQCRARHGSDDSDDREYDRRDRQPVPTRRGPAVRRGTEDHEDQQEGTDQFGEERVPRVARRIAEYAQPRVDARLPEYAPDREPARDPAEELRPQVTGYVRPRRLLRGRQGEGDRRVDVAAGDVPDGVDHRDDHHHERERDDAQLGHGKLYAGRLRDREGRRGRTWSTED